MYGVVLWSDKQKDRAVIWCEDHRNLAFFKNEANEEGRGTSFEPGDLVKFDLREIDDLRLAVDPCLVAPGEYPSLARELMRIGEEAKYKTSLPTRERGKVDVIRFPLTAVQPPSKRSAKRPDHKDADVTHCHFG